MTSSTSISINTWESTKHFVCIKSYALHGNLVRLLSPLWLDTVSLIDAKVVACISCSKASFLHCNHLHSPYFRPLILQ